MFLFAYITVLSSNPPSDYSFYSNLQTFYGASPHNPSWLIQN